MLDRLGGRGRVVGVGISVLVVAYLALTDQTQALVIGVITGLGYSLIALGLVLIYKSSGVFNFAQGEFGTVPLFVLYLAHLNGMPYLFAVLLALIVAAGMGWAVERTVIRPLFESSRVTLLVATAGIALLSIGVTFWLNDAQAHTVAPAITGSPSFTVFGIVVSWQRFLIVAVVAGVGITLTWFFNRTTLGLAVLAASQEATATNLVGISVKRLSSLVWVLAAVLGALAGILAGPFEPFGPGAITSKFLIPGFTAAVIGGMGSLPGAVLGGVIVGVGQSVGASGDLLPASVPGGGAVVTFALLALILLVRPQGLLGKS